VDDGVNVWSCTVDTRMHGHDFACCRVECAFYNLAIKGDACQLFVCQVRDLACRCEQHLLGLGQSYTHVAVPTVRHDARLKEHVCCLDKLLSQLTMAKVCHMFLSILYFEPRYEPRLRANSTKYWRDCGLLMESVLIAFSAEIPISSFFTGTSSFLPFSVRGISGMANTSSGT
jgi:hypothetical protein